MTMADVNLQADLLPSALLHMNRPKKKSPAVHQGLNSSNRSKEIVFLIDR